MEQLVSLVWQLLAGKVAAQVELELATTQAELLEQAAAWRREQGEIGEVVASRLEAASERLGLSIGTTGERLLEQSSAIGKTGAGNPSAAALGGKRPRGRPRKENDLDGILGPSQPITVGTGAAGEVSS